MSLYQQPGTKSYKAGYTMKKIHAAVIGCGGWGPNLLNVFFSNIETKL